MSTLSIASLAATLVLAGNFVPNKAMSQAVPLREAVAEFNRLAQEDEIGRAQPLLTEDEVVAAIRGWVRQQVHVSDEIYDAYLAIADSRVLPRGSKLRFINRWKGHNGFDFEVWWIDLDLGPNLRFTYRLRDRKLRSEPAKK